MSAVVAGLGGDLGGALEAIVGPLNVRRPPSALARRFAVDGASPGGEIAYLVQPGSPSEVAEILTLAGRVGAAIVPVGSGTRATAPSPHAAALAGRPRLFVDSRRMCHVLHLDETSLVVHVQAGLTALALERIVAPRGLSLGDFPPQVLGSTIGGLLSVRTPGKSSPRHGFIEEAVLGVSAVLADGRTVHTRVAPRRASGPDLARALCGSEGTLGFLTAAVLRLHRRPEARFLAAHALPSFDDALAAVRLALREEAAPAALRVYDAAEAHAHLGADVFPTGNDEQAVIVVATAGPTDLAACDRDLVASAAAAMGGTELDERLAELWWKRRTGQERGTALPAPALQVTASPKRQSAVYRAVRVACAGLGVGLRAHASRFEADGAVLFFTLVGPSGAALVGDELVRARGMAEAAASAAGAVLLGTENEELELYTRELRERLDPAGILNPGL
ncbi:MAG TPA: FAD-binding oxidoreductase [Kofleriaceae bacterium]|nr:FAD-binding oxidoreductase [Kofleriaceae bacterium]